MSGGADQTMLFSRRFGPLFATQFLGAFNGNLIKTAIVFLLVFAAGPSSGGGAIVSIAAALFVAPMVLFSAFAGALADARDKAALTRAIKLGEIAAMLACWLAIETGSAPAMLGALFLCGCCSAFFGPIKYAIIPQHVRPGEVLHATGLIEAGTFVAILLGQIAGGLIGARTSAVLALATALAGYAMARRLPAAPPAPGAETLRIAPIAATIDVLSGARKDRAIYRLILAISWFWAVGAILTSQLALFVRQQVHGTPVVATIMLAMFSIGVAGGSLLSSRLSRGPLATRIVPLSALAMSVALGGFVLAASRIDAAATVLNAARFLAQPLAVPTLAALAVMAAAGGLFIVPLYAQLQTLGDPERRARDVAANNIVNALFMVAGAGVAAGLAALGCSAAMILLAVAALNAVVGLMLWGPRRRPASEALGIAGHSGR